MSPIDPPSAIEKRAQNPAALKPFTLDSLREHLPLAFRADPSLPPSPKPRYRSAYRYLGFGDLSEQAIETLSPFEFSLRLFDFSQLEPLLAAHIYLDSAKGQSPFHPVSMYLLSIYRRDQNLSRHEVLRILRHPEDGLSLRRMTGFENAFPSESGLRYFEKQVSPELQQEINALQIDVLNQANLLPVKPDDNERAILSFDGMLHEARSRMRCSSVKASCYEPTPRPCPAQDKGKRGCDCTETTCAPCCRQATPRDPEARLIAYSGDNKGAKASPNAPVQPSGRPARPSRLVYGYYSYAGQLIDDELATYWVLPAAFGPAICGDPALFPDNFAYLQARFPWLRIDEVLADAGICEQTCLDAIWNSGALRLVDIRAHQTDGDPDAHLRRGYDQNGHPLCPYGFVLHSNGYDRARRRTKWRCAKRCLHASGSHHLDCPYLQANYKHGYSTTVGRTHADDTVRLAREIPYGSPTWKKRYSRRNAAESRNSVLQRLGLKRMPVHRLPACHVTVLQGDFVANQRTLVRLIRQAIALA